MKVSRSLKWIRGASTRTRKLARDMLLFWKRIDKEMVHFNSFVKFIDFVDLLPYACFVGSVCVAYLSIEIYCINGIIKMASQVLMFSGK